MTANLPDNIALLRAALAQAEARADAAEAEAARARAVASNTEALIASLKLEIEKLRRELYGTRSERKARLLDQLEFQLEELEATASEDELAAEQAAAKTTAVAAFARKRPSRQPFPDHLPRERVVVPAPASCPCCGSDKLCKLGETISQPPAPFHATPRGWAGPNLLATILFEKFGQHQPLNRQAERFAREGVPLSLSTLADQVGTAAAVLEPLHDLIAAHVMAAGRLHGDDTPVPVLAKGKTDTGRLWVYVRDDRPFAGQAPPAVLFHYSRDRKGEHRERHLAGFTGWLQADAFAGYNRLYEPGRRPGPIGDVLCWAHARRGFFKLADIAANTKRGKDAPPISPLALEAVRRIDALFDLERALSGKPAAERLAARQEHGVALVAALENWLRTERVRLSRHAPVAKAMDYMLTRWDGFTRFLGDDRLCLTNNAAERGLRGIALGRKAWLFCGSDRGGQRAAIMYGLLTTAKLNDVDPQAWLADVLARIADMPQNRLPELLPWNWKPA
ncbi:IS66 family transposase [Azospirillum brasilense]|uniref:IS66 family transposase n=1 Tax=Azospirillum brasilense TaxID=192 RepID=UPI001EDB4C70|nr:IS66 family transposase [Azospirillum brasilense]UKJ76816.1 IS66 family transposase [Azospirillum brasilense]